MDTHEVGAEAMTASAPGMQSPIMLYEQLHSILDQLDTVDTTTTSEADVAAMSIEHERAARRMISIGNDRMMDVSNRAAYRSAGQISLRDFMMGPLRIPNAGKRMRTMEVLCETYTITGEKKSPVYAQLAAALREGTLGAEHLSAALEVMNKIPAALEPEDLTRAETEVVDFSQKLAPRQIMAAGTRLLAHLDPDGTITDHRDRKRQRNLTVGHQDTQSMSRILGTLDPATRAKLDVVLAAWAAPGMNNPDDDASPTGSSSDVDAELLTEAAARDNRTPAQRNHDALSALLTTVLDGGLLGASHRGLPPHLVVRVSDTQLREYAGFGQTTTGTDIPMPELIRLAAQSVMHLAVFSEHTGEPLYFGTAKRLASQSQRFMLFANYGGCSKPGCPAPFSHIEIHHAEQDWAHGGRTDIDQLAPACGPHNRAVGERPEQFTTEKIHDGPDRGRYGWSPNTSPPGLATTNRTAQTNQTAQTNRIHDLGGIVDDRLLRRRAESSASVSDRRGTDDWGTDNQGTDSRLAHSRGTDGQLIESSQAGSYPDGTYPAEVAESIIAMLRDGTLVSIGELEPA